MSTKPSIVIIGAGLGGLALAQGLAGAGLPVTVYERDADPVSRQQGYRISLNAMGMSALEALLPVDRFVRLPEVEVAGVGEGFTFAGAGMRALLSFPAESGARTVRRAALRRHVAEGVPVVWGRRLTGLTATGDGVEVRFADGGRVHADLVVGADGAGSAVREAMRAAGAPVPDVVDLGIESLGGHIDRTPEWDAWLPLNRGGAVQYLGPAGWSLFVSFCERDDRTPTVLWALSRRTGNGEPLGPSREDPVAAAADGMAHPAWHPTLRELVRRTPRTAVVPPLRFKASRYGSKPRVPLWRGGRVTLLGDAAHLMPPQRGLGGNSAFEDARVLVAALAGGGGVAHAVAAYEREMIPRSRRAVEESEEAAQMFHFRNPLAVTARTAALRAAAAWRQAKGTRLTLSR